MTEPDVTAIVCADARPWLLERTLRSVRWQDNAHVEIIVIERRHRNRALAYAAADWVSFIEAGDIWAPNRVASHLANHGGATLAWCGRVILDRADRVTGIALPCAPEALELDTGNLLGGASSVIARTDAIRAAGGLDPSLEVYAEWRLWLALRATGDLAAWAEPLVAERRDAWDRRVRHPRKAVGELAALRRAGLVRSDVPELHAMARDLEGEGRRRQAAAARLVAAARSRRGTALPRVLMALWSSPRDAASAFAAPNWVQNALRA